MIDITIFTPTYNRAHTLEKLYMSLKRQTMHNFQWLIIDDGSTDTTEETIHQFMAEGALSIRYVKQPNAGKHAAMNRGALMAEGKWFFIVDSDDYLTDNAVERISAYCGQIENNPSFAGIVGLRGKNQSEPWKAWYGETDNTDEGLRRGPSTYGTAEAKRQTPGQNEYVDATCIEYRYRLGNQGDRAEVIRTSVLRQYPFPQFEKENFLVEGYLWLTLAKAGYRFRWFQEIIYITEYLSDGLTRNIRRHYLNNPKGSCAFYNLQMSCKGIPWKVQIRAAANYFRYGFHGKYTFFELFKKMRKKAMLPVGMVIGCMLALKDCRNKEI